MPGTRGGSLCLRPYIPKESRRVHGALTGDIRKHIIQSRLLGDREVLVYLPPGYSPKDNWAYPLVLLQDGQNVFNSETSVFGVEWGVDETAERLIADGKMRPIVMAAVYNSPARIDEYTPFPDPDHGGGHADIYKTFLIRELLPFLDEFYHLSRLPEERAVVGSSLGGLLSLHLGWRSDFTFGKVGALSPSLWWGRRGFITSVAGDPKPKRRPFLWLDAGTEESSVDENQNGRSDLIDDLRTMRAVLIAQGYTEGEDLIYREVEGATHDEASWSARVGDVLSFFFPPREHF